MLSKERHQTSTGPFIANIARERPVLNRDKSNTGSEQSALVCVPKQWSEARRKSALEEFRVDAGITSEVPIDVLERDTVTGLEVIFLGCMADVMKHIAKHGKRLGD